MATIQIQASESLIQMAKENEVDISKYMVISLESDVGEATNEFCFKKDGKHMKTADPVISRTNNEQEKEICLIKRKRGPYKDAWCLPGGFRDKKKVNDKVTDEDEAYEDTCYREGHEETSIDLRKHAIRANDLGEICASYNWDVRFSSPVSIGGYHFEVPYDVSCEGADDALVAKWIKLSDIEDGKIHLGFGHPYWLSRAFPENKKLQVVSIAADQNIQGLKKLVNEVRKTKGRAEIPE
jgi:8-oxo-dGTP pyrophosphatase MutT (NUDIX family)